MNLNTAKKLTRSIYIDIDERLWDTVEEELLYIAQDVLSDILEDAIYDLKLSVKGKERWDLFDELVDAGYLHGPEDLRAEFMDALEFLTGRFGTKTSKVMDEFAKTVKDYSVQALIRIHKSYDDWRRG